MNSSNDNIDKSLENKSSKYVFEDLSKGHHVANHFHDHSSKLKHVIERGAHVSSRIHNHDNSKDNIIHSHLKELIDKAHDKIEEIEIQEQEALSHNHHLHNINEQEIHKEETPVAVVEPTEIDKEKYIQEGYEKALEEQKILTEKITNLEVDIKNKDAKIEELLKQNDFLEKFLLKKLEEIFISNIAKEALEIKSITVDIIKLLCEKFAIKYKENFEENIASILKDKIQTQYQGGTIEIKINENSSLDLEKIVSKFDNEEFKKNIIIVKNKDIEDVLITSNKQNIEINVQSVVDEIIKNLET